jgi:hypothetical protein
MVVTTGTIWGVMGADPENVEMTAARWCWRCRKLFGGRGLSRQGAIALGGIAFPRAPRSEFAIGPSEPKEDP